MGKATCSVSSTVTKPRADSVWKGRPRALHMGWGAEVRGQPLCYTRLPADGPEISVDDPPLWILVTSGMLTFKTQPKMSFLISQLGSILFCFLECSCVHLSCRFRLALNSQFSCLSLLSAWITNEGQNIQFDQEFSYKILLSFDLPVCMSMCMWMRVPKEARSIWFPWS